MSYCRADELTRRKANSATSTPTTAKRQAAGASSQERPRISPKVSLAVTAGKHHPLLNNNNHSHPFSNMYHPRTFDYNGDSRKASNSSSSGSSSGANSRKTSNESAGNDDWQDPGQLLNAWLGELDSIRKVSPTISRLYFLHQYYSCTTMLTMLFKNIF